MKIKMHFASTYLNRVLLGLLFILIISGCTVQLVSNYDEKADNAVTQLQKAVGNKGGSL